MDLALLEQTLADAGEPAFRARQVWAWAARGAPGYEAMTDLPATLRDRLADEIPYSTLTLADEAHAQTCRARKAGSPASASVCSSSARSTGPA